MSLGHSPFVYQSNQRGKDPFHLHIIIFMGDRTELENPTPHAISPDEAKVCGMWSKIKWDSKFDGHDKFFEDEGNIKSLYSPAKHRKLENEEVPLTIIVGPKTAEYVLRTNPSPQWSWRSGPTTTSRERNKH